MKNPWSRWLVVPLAALAVQVWGAEYFVAPDGNDGNPGTKAKAFATLDGARDAIRKLKAGAGLPPGGVTVWVRGGLYLLKAPFVLSPEDSGAAGAPIRYQAAPGEGPLLSGAVTIKGWKAAGPDVPGLPAGFADKIKCADIPKGWRFHYLYCNEEALPRSRSVNTNNWRAWPRDWSSGDFSQGGKVDPTLFSAKYTNGLCAVGGQLGWPVSFGTNALNDTLPQNGDLEMFAVMRRYGITANAVLVKVDPAARTAVWLSNLTPPWPNQPRNKMEYEHCYRLENAVSFIDEEGEWAVDSANGKVYCWEPEGTTLANEFAAPAVYNLIMLLGTMDKTGPCVHHVEFRGLTLQYTDRRPENEWPADWLCGPENLWENPDGALYLRGVHDIVVDNCQILRAGAYGITLDRYAQRVTLTRNRIEAPGSGGILFAGYGPGGSPSDVNKDNTIERNVISATGQGNYWHAPGICVFSSGSNRIRYNIITQTPYSGIVMGDTLKATQINAGVKHNRPLLPGQKVGPCEYARLWRISWDELPAAAVEKCRAGTGDFTQEQLTEYLHNRNNLIEQNVIAGVHEQFVEGGAIYAKYTGSGNVYRRNLIYSAAVPNSSILAMDSGMLGSVLTQNVMWVDGPCGVIEAGGKTTAKGNLRVHLDPRGKQKFSRAGIEEGWWTPEALTQPFYALLDEIKAAVAGAGGWPDGVQVDTLVPPRKAP